MKLKILDLNIWNYGEWEYRKPKIIQFIKKHNPDVITFQEIRDDVKFNKKGDNQAKQLKRKLNYPYYAFYAVTDKRKEKPEEYKRYSIEGTAVLSKFPISKITKLPLKKHPKDIHYCGNLFVKINAKEKFNLVVVHFSNNSLFSKLHLMETLKQIKAKKIKPIIVGDFNFWKTGLLNKLIKKDYLNSFEYKKYVSYPQTEKEYYPSPPIRWTLDYILIPKEFKFKSLKCEGKVSDHRALIAEIEI